MVYNKHKRNLHLHVQIDRTALLYVQKMGGTKNPVIVSIANEIWNFLTTNGITITAEYLSSKLNVVADWEYQNHLDSSNWNLESF